MQEEQAHSLALLQNPPGGLPKPTAIIFSGGGHQGFWKLREPIPINGDKTKAEAAARYNIQIEVLYGTADACHNIDRVMRLPGTINWPNKRKRKKGREPAVAKLVEWHEDRVYDISEFTPAPEVSSEGLGFSGKSLKLSGNIGRVMDLSELKIPEWCAAMIIHGEHPTEPERHASRSEALWLVVCELVRCNVCDEKIYAIITDSEYKISDSVLDKRSNIDRYAIHQIESAHEEAVDPQFRELNTKHAVIEDMGGKCRVLSEKYDIALKRTKITFQDFSNFANRYMNRQIQRGTDAEGMPLFVPLGKFWLKHPNRRQFDDIIFAPGQDVNGSFNLWRGFSCEAKPGNCDKFLEHIRKNICKDDDGHYDYLIGWMACAV